MITNRKKWDKKYRESHVEEIKAVKKRYVKLHKKEIQKYKRAYYLKNKKKFQAKGKEYRKSHKKELKIYRKKYYQENRDSILKRCKIYRDSHFQERKILQKKWYEKNKEKVKIDRRRYQLSPLGRLGSYRDSAKRKEIKWSLTKDQWRSFWNKPCFYCGEIVDGVRLDRKNNQKGYVFSNVVSCCKICNDMKKNRSKKEFIKRCKVIARRFK